MEFAVTPRIPLFPFALALALAACSGSASSSLTAQDAGQEAATHHDSGKQPGHDSGREEASTRDGGGKDSTSHDTGAPDARATDSATRDVGSKDTGKVDSAGHDAVSTETGTKDAHAADSGTKDAHVAETGTKDVAVDVGLDTAPGCGTPSASNVFVAEGASAGGIGTQACPFQTIAEGLAAVTTAATTGTACTVTVAPGSYDEPNIVVIAHVTLIGSGGAAATFLTGTSTANCASSPCAISVNRGGTLNGFAISTSSSGPSDGVVGEATAVDDLAPPAILNVTASDMNDGNGIVALGAMNIGPAVSANGNAGQGLWVSGTGTVHVIGSGNTFSSNGANGIDVTGAGALTFDGGSAINNNFNGIRLGGAAGAGPHTIAGLTATGNKNNGIAEYAFSGVQALTLRSSSLVGNGNGGLSYDYGTGSQGVANPLDIGTASSAGGNTFGSTTGAGISLCNAPATQPADGDTFTACPPTTELVNACGSIPATYVDVAYTLATPGGGNPIVATGCTVGL